MFITYCDVNEVNSHVTQKQLQSIYKFLLSNKVTASIDIMNEMLMNMSESQWIEDELQKV